MLVGCIIYRLLLVLTQRDVLYQNDCNSKYMRVKTKAVFWGVQTLTTLDHVYKLLTEGSEDSAAAIFRIILPWISTVADTTPKQPVEATPSKSSSVISVGCESSVCIATRYALDGQWIESRWGEGGEIFCTRPDRPWGPPNWYRVFPRGNPAGAWCWPPTPSSAEAKERVELHITRPLDLRGLL